MDVNELKMLQALPLEIKIAKSKLRIEEWIRYYGEDGVYISFSGGKDSTVLRHLVHQVHPNIPSVFVDTGLEYPELKEFVNKQSNVITLRPKRSFKQVIEHYGYPMVSKEQAHYIELVRRTKSQVIINKHYHGIDRHGNKTPYVISKKHRYLVNAPFPISHKCCDVMKKNPVKKYEKETGRVPFIGTMTGESMVRMQKYLQHGCNAFNTNRPTSTPLGFWNEEDILKYIKLYNLEIPSVYGEILEDENGKLTTSGCKRTGCVFCGFGVHLEKGINRYQLLEQTHPKLHDYCMNKLGFKEVCEFMNLKYTMEQEKEQE